jgi:hypothetical protein
MKDIEPARRIEYVALDDVVPAVRNPKRHRTEPLTASVNRFGFVSPALRDERTGRLVAGHGRIDTVRDLRDSGASPPEGVRIDPVSADWLVPVIVGWASRSDAEADAYLIADNRHAELGGWDNQELAEMMSEFGSDTELLEATGYDTNALADMIKANTPADLDSMAKELGEPQASDAWPTVSIRVPQHIAAAWNAHLNEHANNAVAAFAALLNVDADISQFAGTGG